MTRLTTDQLIRTTGQLEQLAYSHDDRNNLTLFPDLALAIELAVWIDDELKAAKEAAAYGPGSDQIGAHTIGRSTASPVEQRFTWGTEARPRARPELSDPLVRELKKLKAGMRTELGQMVDSWMQRSREAANWPQRTQDTG